MSRPNVLGVGLIGLSATRGWAAAAHVPALRAVPGYELRACSASTPESARAAATAHDVPAACADAAELAARSDVDLVVVTVKVPEHHRLVGAALDAGKAVLCEWPLGNGLAEAEDLAARAAARAVPAFVGLQARSAPPVRAVRELIRTGAIGRVLSTTLVGTGGEWGATVDPPNVYLLDRANGATLLTVPFGHTIDAVCSVLGEFDSLAATTATTRATVRRTDTGEDVPMTAPDQVAVTGTLAGGAVLAAHYRGGRGKCDNFVWTITGTDGEIVLRGPTGHLQFGLVEIAVTADRELRPYEVPAHLRSTDTDPRSRHHTVAEAYAALLPGLRGEPTDVPTFADAVHRHRVLETIENAAASGRRRVL